MAGQELLTCLDKIPQEAEPVAILSPECPECPGGHLEHPYSNPMYRWP